MVSYSSLLQANDLDQPPGHGLISAPPPQKPKEEIRLLTAGHFSRGKTFW